MGSPLVQPLAETEDSRGIREDLQRVIASSTRNIWIAPGVLIVDPLSGNRWRCVQVDDGLGWVCETAGMVAFVREHDYDHLAQSVTLAREAGPHLLDFGSQGVLFGLLSRHSVTDGWFAAKEVQAQWNRDKRPGAFWFETLARTFLTFYGQP